MSVNNNSSLNSNANMPSLGNSPQTDWYDFSNWGSLLQGFGSILGGWSGLQNYRLGKDSLNFNRKVYSDNRDMQLATSAAQIQGRLADYAASGVQMDTSFLTDLLNTLQSFSQGNNPQVATAVDAAAAAPTGATAPQQQSSTFLPNVPVPNNPQVTLTNTVGATATQPAQQQQVNRKDVANDLRKIRL